MQKSVQRISELFDLLGVSRSTAQQENDQRVPVNDVIMALLYAPDCSSSVCAEACRQPLACATSCLHRELSQGRPACIRTRDNSVVYTCDRRSACNEEWLIVDIPVCEKTGCHSKTADIYTLPVGAVESDWAPERQSYGPGCIRSLVRGPCSVLPPDAVHRAPRSRSASPPAKKRNLVCDSVPLLYNCQEDSEVSSENGTSECTSSSGTEDDHVQPRTPSPVRSSGSAPRLPLVGGMYAPPGAYGKLRRYLMR